MGDSELLTLLKVAFCLSPVAVYFLLLGLLNCQAHPRLVGGRRDFLTLMASFTPLLVWMVQVLAELGPARWTWWILSSALLAAALLLTARVPRELTSWVIYNVTAEQLGPLLVQAFRRQGIACRWDQPHVRLQDRPMRVHLAEFGLLRNVTVYLRTSTQADRRLVAQVRRQLEQSLIRVQTLPSAAGAALLLVGTLMLILPVMMMADDMDTIVKILNDYLS